LFLDTPYYLGPDGPVAQEGFGVLREALRRTKRIGIGRVVLAGKEKLVALKAQDKGLVLFTLRYVAAVRPAAVCFDDLENQPVDLTQLALAQKLIEAKSGPFNLASFSDRYQDALLQVIKAKIAGTKPVLAPCHGKRQVTGLMEALRKSLSQSQRKVDLMVRKNGHGKASLAA
jgi:DNA end-binding protein Ku